MEVVIESNKKIAGLLCNNWNFPLYESSIYRRELSVLVNWYEINDKVLKTTGHDEILFCYVVHTTLLQSNCIFGHKTMFAWSNCISCIKWDIVSFSVLNMNNYSTLHFYKCTQSFYVERTLQVEGYAYKKSFCSHF